MVVALGVAALVGLSACGTTSAPANLAAEAAALQTVGFDTGLEAPAPAPSAGADSRAEKRQERRIKVRKYLRKNTLHGEMTVQTKDGVKTIVVQRGTVTAADGKTINVKSTDGYALTWTADADLKVVQDKKKVDATAIKAGTEIGVAGTKDGTVTTARLVAVK